jgi:hypothetical protein
MDKAYIDFTSLYRMHKIRAFFVTRAKVSLDYLVNGRNFNIDEKTGLRSDMTIKLNDSKSKIR